MLKNTQEDLKNSEIYCNKLYEKNSNHMIQEKTHEKNYKNKQDEMILLNLKFVDLNNEKNYENEKENINGKNNFIDENEILKNKIILLEKTVGDYGQISDGESNVYGCRYMRIYVYIYVYKSVHIYLYGFQ